MKIQQGIEKLGFSVGITDRTSVYYPPNQDEIVSKIDEIIEILNSILLNPSI